MRLKLLILAVLILACTLRTTEPMKKEVEPPKVVKPTIDPPFVPDPDNVDPIDDGYQENTRKP